MGKNALSFSGSPDFSGRATLKPTSIADWLTFTHSSGISFRYPSGWQLEEINPGTNMNQVQLTNLAAITTTMQFTPVTAIVGFGTQMKDINEYYAADPRLRYFGNENGAGIRWLSEIKKFGVVGLKYLWAPDVFPNPYITNSLFDGGNLSARLISVVNDSSTFKTKYYVSVIWPIDNKNGNIDYAGQYGTERMVKDRYQMFEEFVDSIRFPGE